MRQIIFACLVAVSLAAPKPQNDVTVLRDERVDLGDGNFNYAFELSDGTAVEAVGYPGEGGAVTIRGTYRYTLPDGEVVQITYVADEAGFRPEGDSIPSILEGDFIPNNLEGDFIPNNFEGDFLPPDHSSHDIRPLIVFYREEVEGTELR